MDKTKRLLSLAVSAALAASSFSALFTVTAGAAEEQSAVKITATYKDSGELDGVTIDDVTIAPEDAAMVVDGSTRIMYWDSIAGMKPIYKAATLPVTYLDDDFSAYTSTGVTTQGKEAQSAVMGNFIVYVGNRGSGGDAVSTAAIEDGSLKIVSGKYATSSRGASIALNTDAVTVPAFSEAEDGAVIEYSFDAKFSDENSTIQLFGITSNTTSSGGTAVNDPYLSVANNSAIPTGEWVNISIGVDNTKKAYLVITNADGNIIYTSTFTAVGDTFEKLACYGGVTTVYVDNFKVEQKLASYGTVDVTVTDSSGAAVEGADVSFDSYVVTTGSDGTASAMMPNGTYTITASKAGYEHTTGMMDNDSTEVTVSGDTVTAAMSLSVMNYDKIPDTVTVENGDTFVAAPKTDDTSSTAAFTVKVLDQYGIEMAADEYTLEWAVYASGTETTDENVTIDENGVVSVAKAFNVDDNVAQYDVVATVTANNAGLRSNKGTTTITVGNCDVTYYEALGWSVANGTRTSTVTFGEAVSLTDLVSVTLNMSMNYTEGNSNLCINSSAGKLVGIQHTGTTLTAWTAWSGSSTINQQTDTGAFTSSGVLTEAYTNGETVDITFVIDPTAQTITVSMGDATVSLPYTISATDLTGLQMGQYRNYGGLAVNTITVREPDENYLNISGDIDFAKVSGQTITKQYALGQSVIVADETFSWSISPSDDGVTIDENGLLSVADTAAAGTYTITATSSVNEAKTASLPVEIGDYQTIEADNAFVDGPRAITTVGETATYSVTKLVDSYGDDVTDLLPAAVWTSSDTSVATIDASTGVLTTLATGETTVTATITNGTAVTTLTVPLTVSQYYITADAAGDSTEVDTSALVSDDAITGYTVTTSKDGKLVKQTVETTAPTTVDTTGADKLEIAPIFSYSNVTKSNSVTAAIPADTYNFDLTGASGTHFDPYANDQMLANNMLQGGSAVNYIAVNDIVVKDGYAILNLKDAADDSVLGNVTITKSPSIVDRTRKIYVLGDSLVCIYYNGGSDTNNTYQTGWGQVLQSYIKDAEVVDLGNSGVTAEGLAGSAITQVAESAKEGDIMLLESGYNDRTYTTQAAMTEAVTAMYNTATEKGVKAILVSPNASAHDYKASVAWGGTMMTIADDLGAEKIDLGTLSYNFLYSTYADDTTNVKATYNVSDGLHSQYRGAQKMASIVASAMLDLGYTDVVDTDYSYTFTDTLGNSIVCQAAAAATTE